MAIIIFIPIFALFHKKAIPFFLALIQHSLLGDYITGGQIQLVWPLTTNYYGMGISIESQTNITLEWLTFLASMIIMLKANDTLAFFQPHNSNLILTIPTFTVLLPTFLNFPLEIPTLLIPPHLVYIAIFSVSIILSMGAIFSKHLSVLQE
jgi:hypothetical protein